MRGTNYNNKAPLTFFHYISKDVREVSWMSHGVMHF